MAKKKNSQFLPGFLEDIMSLLTPEEQEIAFELFNDGAFSYGTLFGYCFGSIAARLGFL